VSGWRAIADVATSATWALFGLVWLAGAIYNRRRGPATERQSFPSASWIAGAVVVWLGVLAIPDSAWNAVEIGPAWPRAVGLALLVAGFAFTLWARAALGKMWSSGVLVKTGHELRTEGPYAITRHPIYTGILGMVAGSALLQSAGRWLAVCVVAGVLVAMKVRAEERLLESEFGDAYAAYRRRVPRLVPLAWRW
jgi:protein-S-isoprenylcysteine O-methyltransferase Ste14